MLRRIVLKTVVAIPASLVFYRPLAAQQDRIAEIGQDIISYSESVEEIENSLRFRDPSIFSTVEKQGGMSGRPSSLTIHQYAKDLIISSEVSGKAVYEKRYKTPIWPYGESGITIGIGYDLGYVSANTFSQHWKDIIDDEKIKDLKGVCQRKGPYAQDVLSSVKHVSVEWNDALKQFEKFLPYAIGETALAFPNSDKLSPLSLGALVSLVYNRGTDTSNSKPSRQEMHNIKNFMKTRQYEKIPSQIRLMKRLWENKREASGLLKRRDLEARLFEAGLA